MSLGNKEVGEGGLGDLGMVGKLVEYDIASLLIWLHLIICLK